MKFGKQEKAVFSRSDKRGKFSELVNYGQWQSLITGKMKKSSSMGFHYHKNTIVYFYLLSGKASVKTLNTRTGKKKRGLLKPGEGYVFRPEEVRVIRYLRDSSFLILKSRRYNHLRPDLIGYKKDF